MFVFFFRYGARYPWCIILISAGDLSSLALEIAVCFSLQPFCLRFNSSRYSFNLRAAFQIFLLSSWFHPPQKFFLWKIGDNCNEARFVFEILLNNLACLLRNYRGVCLQFQSFVIYPEKKCRGWFRGTQKKCFNLDKRLWLIRVSK